jgi:hypothetical protein
MSSISLPQPLGPWAPWAPEIQNFSMHIVRWVQAGQMVPPLTVLATDQAGKFLFSFVADQKILGVGLILPPVHPVDVTVIDSKATVNILHFP